jgi:hypothetical protein
MINLSDSSGKDNSLATMDATPKEDPVLPSGWICPLATPCGNKEEIFVLHLSLDNSNKRPPRAINFFSFFLWHNFTSHVCTNYDCTQLFKHDYNDFLLSYTRTLVSGINCSRTRR